MVGRQETVDPAVGDMVSVGRDVVGSSVGPRVGGGVGLCVRASHLVPKKHISPMGHSAAVGQCCWH